MPHLFDDGFPAALVQVSFFLFLLSVCVCVYVYYYSPVPVFLLHFARLQATKRRKLLFFSFWGGKSLLTAELSGLRGGFGFGLKCAAIGEWRMERLNLRLLGALRADVT